MHVSATFIESLAAWATLGTALGTAGLAATTFMLARKTAAEVKAATKQARASARQVAAPARQAEAAERALLARTQPLLSDVPGTISNERTIAAFRLHQLASKDRRTGTDEHAAAMSILVGTDHPASAYFRVPFRNVGNGPAIIETAAFSFSGDAGIEGAVTTPVVPPGEIAAATLSLSDQSPWLPEVVAMYEHCRNFAVVLGYADAEGTPRGAIRLDVYARDEGREWYIRQVFWADTPDAVRRDPAFGSQPSA